MKIRIFFLILVFPPFFLFSAGQKNISSDRDNPVFSLPYKNLTFPSNPLHIQDPDILRLTGALYQGLTRPDPETGEALAALAGEWHEEKQSRVFTFFLKKAFWSNGEPITAEQVRDSWMKALDPLDPSPYSWILMQYIKGAREYVSGEASREDVAVIAVSEDVLKVVLTGSVSYFPQVLTHPVFRVYPFHLFNHHGLDPAHPELWVVSGPYIPEEGNLSEGISLKWNPAYGKQPEGSPGRIRFSPVSDEEEALILFREGSIDWLPGDLFPRQDLQILAGRPDFFNPQALISYFYLINKNRSALKSPEIRKALSFAVDRDSLIRNVLQGEQEPSWSPVPGMQGFSARSPSELLYPLRLEEARKLRNASGFSAGTQLNLLIIDSPGHKSVAEFLTGLWEAELDISFSITAVDSLTFYELRRTGQYDLALGGWRSEIRDPFPFLSLFLTGESPLGGSYSSAEYDSLLIDSALEQDRDKRMELLKKAEEILCQTDPAVIPLYFSTVPQLFRKDLWRGFYSNPQDVHPLTALRIRS